MQVMKYICVAVALGMWFTIAIAQHAAPAQNAPVVKHVPIKDTPSNDGKEMYDNYCAVCHRKDGRGTGPAAPSMKTSPTDLAALAKNHSGKYPAPHVAAVIRGQATTSAHGSQDIPVWGPLFSRISQGHEAQVQQRITNLVNYLETLRQNEVTSGLALQASGFDRWCWKAEARSLAEPFTASSAARNRKLHRLAFRQPLAAWPMTSVS